MIAVIGTCALMLAVMTAVGYALFFAGRSLPRVGYVLAFFSFMIVIGLWTLMIVENADGPGGGLGLAFAGAASLICLAAGMGLISGAIGSTAPLIGLGLALAISGTIHLWLVPSANPLVGAAILLLFCIGGCLVARARKAIAQSA